MLATKDIELTRATVRDLRDRGEEERAAAVESVLAAATALVPRPEGPAPAEYLTLAQAARALGISTRTVREWVAGGGLRTVRVARRVLVPRRDLLDFVARLPEPAAPAPDTRAAPLAAEARRRAFVFARLPAEKVTGLEALHQQMEDGERLSRAEQGEMAALERELADAAARGLE